MTTTQRNKRVPEMMGATEVAKELGVSRANLRKVAGLPEPAINYLSRGELWRADVIREFAAKRRERFDLPEPDREPTAA